MDAQLNYWLIKSEPESYSIDVLKKDKKISWTGVRNYQARNFMREMRVGDIIFFYHSSCAVPGIYGLARVTQEATADPTQFDLDDYHYDPRSKKEKPLWDAVQLTFVQKFAIPFTITQMRAEIALHGMALLQKGSRLSVTPVSASEAAYLLKALH